MSYDSGINKIEEFMGVRSSNPKGTQIHKDVTEDYTTYILGKIRKKKPLKVVIDSGNGACSEIAPLLFKKAGCEVISLYCEPDGEFPNHQADPIKKSTLVDLQKKVIEEKADFGIGFDGDGDRVGFVDEKGNYVEGYNTFCLLATHALRERPGSKIIYEVTCSQVVEDIIKNHGGVPLISRVGHSYIHHTLLKEQSIFAGESSGHYFYLDNYGFDDAVFAALKMWEIVQEMPLSELVETIPSYITSQEERIPCADDKKFAVVEEMKKSVKDKHDILDIDGVKVLFEDGWFIARASNTQPAIVFRWEAKTQESYKEIERLARQYLDQALKLK